MCWGDLGFHSDKEAIRDLGILKMIVLADVWRIDRQRQHRSRAVRWHAFLFSSCDRKVAYTRRSWSRGGEMVGFEIFFVVGG